MNAAGEKSRAHIRFSKAGERKRERDRAQYLKKLRNSFIPTEMLAISVIHALQLSTTKTHHYKDEHLPVVVSDLFPSP